MAGWIKIYTNSKSWKWYVHAGNENSFIKNLSLIFQCKRKTRDNYDNMNTQNFKNWFKSQLFPNLEQPSMIIMDIATYHI